MAKSWLKLRMKWNFELTVFELAVPDLYYNYPWVLGQYNVLHYMLQASMCNSYTVWSFRNITHFGQGIV